MPKALPAETCRADVKRNCAASSSSGKKSPSQSSVAGVAGSKSAASAAVAERTAVAGTAKKKVAAAVATAKPRVAKTPKPDHEAKLKGSGAKKAAKAASVKTRSGVGAAPTKDMPNARLLTEAGSAAVPPSKSKDKAKAAQPLSAAKDVTSKSKPKEVAAAKRTTATKNAAAKKTKIEQPAKSGDVRNEPVSSCSATASPKKDAKKRKEQLSAGDTAATVAGRDQAKKATSKSAKKMAEETAVEPKKESPKATSADEAAVKKEAKVADERCVSPKKRTKHKCTVDGLGPKKEPAVDEKPIGELPAAAAPVLSNATPDTDASSVRKVKFFKSKNRNGDKSKDAVAVVPAVKAESFSVYDNLDEDSEESTKKCSPKKRPCKPKGEAAAKERAAQIKRRLDESQKCKPAKEASKVKKPEERKEKRKLESESEPEAKPKKVKRTLVVDSDYEDASQEKGVPSKSAKNTAKAPKKTNKKLTIVSKGEEESSSSDNAPLNRLIANKRSPKTSKAALKREVLLSDESSDSGKSKKRKAKSSTPQKVRTGKSPVIENSRAKSSPKVKSEESKASKTPAKKSVKFTKEVCALRPAAKPTFQRHQRMASLNAMAMVHCMYENESKNVSVSSVDSTENSDNGEHLSASSAVDNSPTPTACSSKRSTSPKKSVTFQTESGSHRSQGTAIELDKPVSGTLVKFEPSFELAADPVISRESLRMAPGLRSVGKHWDMNGSSISSTLSEDNETLAVAAAAAASAKSLSPPAVVKELKDASFLEKPSPLLSSKKKFARASRHPVLDDSSEEEKHRALLLEEKQRMIRRRRRQRSKEITMDLKDMVVCKRMASLNATAILAASYSSSAAGRRAIAVKSPATSGCKSEEKRLRENAEESSEEKTMGENLVAKMKTGRGKLPFIRKKFSSSSDADNEDEADMSGGEVVVKTASSSGKQQVSLIVNQDSGVTITGLYLNSTTKSTHHQGYCSISGMQYRISSTSHTQTEATTVTTEAIVRTPQEPLRSSMAVSMHGDRQNLSPGQQNVLSASHPSPIKTYTPLGALSSMQPPGSPHHLHHHHHHPKTVAIASSTQEISSLERHGCPSAFSAPTVYGPAPPPPSALTTVATRPPYPLLSKTPPESAFVAGYYQPAGPLISHHHHHHHHHHHVQTNTTVTTSASSLPTATATSASPSAATISFSKVSQSPPVQPPTPPASNVTQPVGSELSDSEMASATTPAAEITVVSEGAVDEGAGYPPLGYHRFPGSSSGAGLAASAAPPYRSPSHSYQSYYPSPPSTASLSHQTQPQQPQAQAQQQQHFQEVLYSGNGSSAAAAAAALAPAAGAYHHGYLPVKGPLYPPPLQRRYIPALAPQPQYFHHEYPAPVPLAGAVSQQQLVMPAHPLAAAASDSYHSAPSTPSIIESYPPPLPPPPPSLYYSGYSSAPPTPYYPYATSSRSLTLVETSCPCPLQGCQKNVDTGPLTGFISKGPVEQRNTPLSPVALSLPKEPHDIRSLPSPARGSAGSRPTPSPAIATAKNPSSAWNETCCDYGCDTAGLLAIGKMGGAVLDSAADLDSGIDGIGDLVDEAKPKRRSKRHEIKKRKLRRIRNVKEADDSQTAEKFGAVGAGDQCFGKLCDRVTATETAVSPDAACLSFPRSNSLTSAAELCDSTDTSYVSPEPSADQAPTIKCQKNCKRWRECADDEGDPSDLDMPPKLYPEVDIGYQNRLRRNSAAVVEDEPPAKRVKSAVSPLAQLLDVDVEKSTYLSALELRSVSDSTPESAPAVMSASALVESLAPLNGYADKRVKMKAAEKGAQSERALPVAGAEFTPRSSACRKALAVAKCRKLSVEARKPRFRRRRWTTKKKTRKKKATAGSQSNEEEKLEAENAERQRRAELLSLTQKRAACRLKWSNGWTWLGEPFVAKVFMNTEGSEVLRACYHAMKHHSGDIIRPKDCILLRSGCKKTDLPYVAKVAHLWEDPEDGEMMMSLFWYYRPEHTEHDAKSSESPYELFASKHKDINSVACIEDKCYVLTFNEYCRYHKSIRQTEESVDISSVIVPPLGKKRYPRLALLPPENTSLDLVYFCRKIYDFRQHRLLKNPFFV